MSKGAIRKKKNDKYDYVTLKVKGVVASKVRAYKVRTGVQINVIVERALEEYLKNQAGKDQEKNIKGSKDILM